MQKAIAVIQLKLEGQIVQPRPHYQMNARSLLDKIDHVAGDNYAGKDFVDRVDTLAR